MTNAIFISGWAHDADVLRPLAAALPELNVECCSPANLGTAPDDALAAKLVAAPAPVLLLGWSLGAQFALRAALRTPHQVARLVLLAGTPKFCADPDHAWRCGTPEANLRALITGLRRRPESALRSFLELCGHCPDAIAADFLPAALAQAPETLLRGLEALRDTDLRPQLRALTMPTFLAHGKQDQVIPWLASGVLAQQILNARLQLLPDAAHNLPLTHVATLAPLLRVFLAERL